MRLLLPLIGLFACARPASVAPPPEAPVAPVEAAPAEAAPVAAPAPVVAAPAPSRLPPPPPSLVGTDARTLTNAWRVKHNEGVGLLAKGDAAGALAAGLASLALAPAEHREGPLVLVAAAAAQARDVPTELEALDALLDGADVPWGVFYNGSVDAAAAGRPDLASRFALAALARTDDVAAVGPMALRAALAAGDLDGALTALARLDGAADPGAVAALARALSLAGRCPDARRIDPGVCS